MAFKTATTITNSPAAAKRRGRREAPWLPLALVAAAALLQVPREGFQPREEMPAPAAMPTTLQACVGGGRPGELLHIVPMEGKTFGARVFGLDPHMLGQDDAAAARAAAQVHSALEEHLVLVFPNVTQNLSPEAHLRLSKMLGPVDPVISGPPQYLFDSKFNSPQQVQRALEQGASLDDLTLSMRRAAQTSELPREVTRIVKEPSDVVAFGEGWHSDLTFHRETPFAALLASRELPSSGGNTHFLDMREAFDALPADVQDQLDSLAANHTDGNGLWGTHPAVRHDHKSGRRSLFVNRAFTRHFVGDDVPEGLLDGLLRFVEEMPRTAPRAFLDIEWHDGQLLIWDNRFTQHAANADYHERREMHRTIVSGSRPV